MLGKPGKLRIRTGAGQDLGIARGDQAPALALERPRNDRSPAVSGAGIDDLVNEIDKLVWESNSDLLTHTNMVPDWYQPHAPQRASLYSPSTCLRSQSSSSATCHSLLPSSVVW
jgi:hypothetical protein